MDKLKKNRNGNLEVERNWERNNKNKTVPNNDAKRKTSRSKKDRYDDFDFEFGNDIDNFPNGYSEDAFHREFGQTNNTNLECGNDNCLNNRNKFD